MNDSDPSAPGPVSRWLERLRGGDREGLDPLMQLVYGELRQAARRQIQREGRDHTLSPTALVHEVYLKLRQQRQAGAGVTQTGTQWALAGGEVGGPQGFETYILLWNGGGQFWGRGPTRRQFASDDNIGRRGCGITRVPRSRRRRLSGPADPPG